MKIIINLCTRWRVTLNASLHRSGVFNSSHKACPINATLLDKRTSEPIKKYPAQLDGCEKCLVC